MYVCMVGMYVTCVVHVCRYACMYVMIGMICAYAMYAMYAMYVMYAGYVCMCVMYGFKNHVMYAMYVCTYVY